MSESHDIRVRKQNHSLVKKFLGIYCQAINPKLYLLRRKKRGDVLHQAKEGLLVVTLPCWSIFGRSRVFLGFPLLGFWRAWRVIPAYIKLRVCTLNSSIIYIYEDFSHPKLSFCIFIFQLSFSSWFGNFQHLYVLLIWHKLRLKLLRV